MSETAVSREAVEAALEAYQRPLEETTPVYYEQAKLRMRSALAAALPHLGGESRLLSGEVREALERAMEWSANFPLKGEASAEDCAASDHVYELTGNVLAKLSGGGAAGVEPDALALPEVGVPSEAYNAGMAAHKRAIASEAVPDDRGLYLNEAEMSEVLATAIRALQRKGGEA